MAAMDQLFKTIQRYPKQDRISLFQTKPTQDTVAHETGGSARSIVSLWRRVSRYKIIETYDQLRRIHSINYGVTAQLRRIHSINHVFTPQLRTTHSINLGVTTQPGRIHSVNHGLYKVVKIVPPSASTACRMPGADRWRRRSFPAEAAKFRSRRNCGPMVLCMEVVHYLFERHPYVQHTRGSAC